MQPRYGISVTDLRVRRVIYLISGWIGLPGFWLAEGLGPGRVDSRGCFFVTRAKSNRAYQVKEQYDVEGGVLEDEDIYLTSYASKKEYGSLLRRVV